MKYATSDYSCAYSTTTPDIPQATAPRDWEPPVDPPVTANNCPAFASTPFHPYIWLHSIWCMSSFVDYYCLLIRETPGSCCYQQEQLDCSWPLTWIEVEKSSRCNKSKKKKMHTCIHNDYDIFFLLSFSVTC